MEASLENAAKISKPGLDNVYRITNKLISGSCPEGEEGFQSLKELGVRTVISVDGARPEIDRARKYALRYVHLPFGYDGIAYDRVLQLAKAVRDLPGPIYLHCHHGMHRGPAAAAAVHLCLDEKCTVEQAVAEMKRAGTDPRYTGLYRVPLQLLRPSPEVLDKVPAQFPEVVEVSGLARHMVGMDEQWDHLKLVRAAGWQAPLDHPDLDPAHEALLLEEQYRECARLPSTKERPDEFRGLLTEAEQTAQALETVLRSGRTRRTVDAAAAQNAFEKVNASCVQCHAKFRDVPQSR